MRLDKLRTVESLADQLDRELSWRRKELMQIRMAARESAEAGGDKVVLRGSILIIYANWEGFIRQAANFYVGFVFNQKLPLTKLYSGFWAIDLVEEFNRIKQTEKKRRRMDFVDQLLNRRDNLEHSKYVDKLNKRYINTESNLNIDRFKDIIAILGLRINLSLGDTMIDLNLLSPRNEIAHGGKRTVSTEDVLEICNYVMGQMENFYNGVLEAAEKKYYIVS
ncbi:MAE_28990/MAE_18760 family HEPN-like nuclease [uncultured Secundilactobacillus sp.]|uniref:MAE_28990/MAE_18760 family HEPN-like nuclease n=1 Tax=uncultured Secundilactobacillus sp. TaxID=2813935 RepID=UPI00258A137A|nr:MAE_28990/MAE_18760 family HEPN-like nuclease [uncultured Secundilactobacillus sp.]